MTYDMMLRNCQFVYLVPPQIDVTNQYIVTFGINILSTKQKTAKISWYRCLLHIHVRHIST